MSGSASGSLSGQPSGSGASTACPASLPAADSPCSPPGLVCSYGADPRPKCRDRATCRQVGAPNTWYVTPANCGASGVCPGTQPQTGTACASSAPACLGFAPSCTDTTECTFGATACSCHNLSGGCGNCPPSPTWQWDCAPLPAAPCPSTPPDLGAKCAINGTNCNYLSCAVSCTNGVWVPAASGC
jgi:hypothetical protein